MHWFYQHGFGPEEVTADCGIDLGGGGRQPDVTIWAKGQPPQRARSSYAGLTGLLLAIEVVSPDSEMIDHVIKKAEYAAAGVPRYWIVAGDSATTVHMLQLGPNGGYEPERDAIALNWLLNQPVPNLA
jgi:Uma2 family endonuclease